MFCALCFNHLVIPIPTVVGDFKLAKYRQNNSKAGFTRMTLLTRRSQATLPNL